jgi:hypothetical protein
MHGRYCNPVRRRLKTIITASTLTVGQASGLPTGQAGGLSYAELKNCDGGFKGITLSRLGEFR